MKNGQAAVNDLVVWADDAATLAVLIKACATVTGHLGIVRIKRGLGLRVRAGSWEAARQILLSWPTGACDHESWAPAALRPRASVGCGRLLFGVADADVAITEVSFHVRA